MKTLPSKELLSEVLGDGDKDTKLKWNPKEGETLWRRYSKSSKWFIDEWVNSVTQRKAIKNGNCEPFIGELPSFTKDKQCGS